MLSFASEAISPANGRQERCNVGLRTSEQFLAGLKDGREVYYRGERVGVVPEHPELGVAARHAAIDFDLA
jgi:aromatic ring hydroxylase